MKKTLLIAAIVAAGITFAMADDGQPAGRLYKIGEHTVEIDADCMILSLTAPRYAKRVRIRAYGF